MFIPTNRRKPVSLMLVVLLIGAFLGMFPAPAGGEAEKTRPWFEGVQKPGESSAQKGKWGAAPFKASSSGLPLYRALGADDNVPGVPLPPSPVIGTLDEYTDFIDVYSVQLNPGDVLSASITGPAGSDFDLYLFAPGTIDVYYADPVAGAAGGSYPDSFSYTVPAGAGGTYYLMAATFGGSGSYTITYTVQAGGSPPPPPQPEPDDNVPGVPIPPSPITGTIDANSDIVDVYSVQLSPGDTIDAWITGPSGSLFLIALHPPGTTDVITEMPVAYSDAGGYPDSLSYTVPAGAGGTYYLGAFALVGSGAYSISYALRTGFGSETRIITSGWDAAISGDKVAYTNNVPGENPNIFLHDLKTNTRRQITTNPASQEDPAIHGDVIVWTDYRNLAWNNRNYDIYAYDLKTGRELQLTTNGYAQSGAAVYGQRVVWTDERNSGGNGNGLYDIYLYDLATNAERRITSTSSNVSSPSIYGDKIVWVKYVNGLADIYLYDLSTNTERKVASTNAPFAEPRIYGDKIVWRGEVNGVGDVFLFDLETNTLRRFAIDREQSAPSISNDLLVWSDQRNGQSDIYLYDLARSSESRVTVDPSNQSSPGISGNRIIWSDTRASGPGIYLTTYREGEFIPAPDVWVARDGSELKVSWTRATIPDVAWYEIERSSDKANWTLVGTSTAESINDAPPSPNVRFYYRARVRTARGNYSQFSPYVSGLLDTIPPGQPTSLKVTGRTAVSVTLSWAKSTDNDVVSSYIVERSLDGRTFSQVGKVAETYFVDKGLKPQTTYYYRVKALDSSLNASAPSAVLTAKTRSSIANDFQGDGRSDGVALYDYGSSSTGIWIFNSVRNANASSGVMVDPSLGWRSANGGFDPSRIKAVTGDFNGDGKADVIGLYNYGGTSSGLWLWKSTGSSYAGPTRVFFSSAWAWDNTKLVSGDFNGDGKDELFAFYTYGGTTTGVFVFEQNSDGTFKYPRRVFLSPYWDWTRTRLLSVRDGNKSKVVAAYNYGGTKTGLWTFELDAGGNLKYPALSFVSEQWDFSKTSFITGDVNADEKTDVVAFYNYGGSQTGAFAFKATGLSGDKAFAYPERYFYSPYWDSSRSTYIPGDFNGDGKEDAAAVYDYGGGRMGFCIFTSDGGKFAGADLVYTTPYWNNAAARWLMPY